MRQPRLRVYFGPHEDSTVTAAPKAAARTVQVTVGEILPLLSDAVCSERTWLSDFEDDQITISTDLYEVLLAYQHYRRPTG